MRTTSSYHPPLTAAAVIAAASAALGQSCIWTYVPGQPQHYGVAVYHSGLQRVLFLATSGIGVAAVQTWAWDGTAWTLLDSSGPSPRTLPGVAYDSARDRVVLFGGSGSTSLADTWEWDRTTWVRASLSGPAARWAPEMVYDESRQRTVLFGGLTSSSVVFGDTWEWDGHDWVLASTTGPAPRGGSAIAYDSLRARTMLYGGVAGSSHFDDLWEWDGAVWTQRVSTTPGTQAVWMVFDPARNRMIAGRVPLAGGSETWELNPITAAWTIRDPGTAPYGPVAFDVARSVAVALALPGGIFSTAQYNGAATAFAPYIVQQPPSGTYIPGATVVLAVQGGGTSPAYQWFRNGQPLSDGGRISGATTASLTIQAVETSDIGSYRVTLTGPCGMVESDPAYVAIDPWLRCYANCDLSTTPPFLNVNDFVCFLNKFAAGDTYANCTGGCNPPPCLNILDFGCFINRFVAGCSAP